MPRKPHKYHYLYKTVCTITDRFYYGMHSTSDLEDGYIGSGTRLWRSINKHGRENHSIEILEYFTDRKTLKIKEKEIITEDLLNDSMCMNLQLGGGGGFCSDEHAKKFHKAGGRKVFQNHSKIHASKIIEDSDYYTSWKKAISEGLKGETNTWRGQTHTEETINKIRKSSLGKHTGSKNSQFGTRWITNGLLNKKIKKTETIPLGWSKGRKIK